jgi:O-succinylbenzoic acid--CoA ligase
VKIARHDERTLAAAARGFCAHFGLERVNAVDVLPPYHVSGLMARVRCAVSGGSHVAWDWKRLESGEFPGHRQSSTVLQPALKVKVNAGTRAEAPRYGGSDWVISLVPTQLQRLLAMPAGVEWLQGFAIILLGGGPTWPELADAAVRAALRVSLSYGMTETAAMVTALRPEEFLAGARSCGSALPHARVRVTPEGRIAVGGESLFCGYVGEPKQQGDFLTDDLGRIDECEQLHVLGRADAVIITGGKKVQPADIEAALRASGEFADVAVIGVPDAEWGEAVVACYPAGGKAPQVARAVVGLAAHQRPKRFMAVKNWPRNAQGKIDRAALRRLVESG